MPGHAVLSLDGHYRYWLARRWESGVDSPAVFIMLNPSTADATTDDPTIRRCIGYAKAWGHNGLIVVNLYALRSTDPTVLLIDHDPVGPDNDAYLLRAAGIAHDYGTPLIAAWGTRARSDRVKAVCALPGFRLMIAEHRLAALALTKGGQPCHPLRLRADLTPIPWEPALAGQDGA